MKVPSLRLSCDELKETKTNFISGVKTKKVKEKDREKLLKYIKSLQEKGKWKYIYIVIY